MDSSVSFGCIVGSKDKDQANDSLEQADHRRQRILPRFQTGPVHIGTQHVGVIHDRFIADDKRTVKTDRDHIPEVDDEERYNRRLQARRVIYQIRLNLPAPSTSAASNSSLLIPVKATR